MYKLLISVSCVNIFVGIVKIIVQRNVLMSAVKYAIYIFSVLSLLVITVIILRHWWEGGACFSCSGGVSVAVITLGRVLLFYDPTLVPTPANFSTVPDITNTKPISTLMHRSVFNQPL